MVSLEEVKEQVDLYNGSQEVSKTARSATKVQRKNWSNQKLTFVSQKRGRSKKGPCGWDHVQEHDLHYM